MNRDERKAHDKEAVEAAKWDETGERCAKSYARELGGWPRGTSLVSVVAHTRGWNDCIEHVARELSVENDALKARVADLEKQLTASQEREARLAKAAREFREWFRVCVLIESGYEENTHPESVHGRFVAAIDEWEKARGEK